MDTSYVGAPIDATSDCQIGRPVLQVVEATMVGRSCGRMTQDIHAEVLHTVTLPATPPTAGVESEQGKISERVSSLELRERLRRPALKCCALDILLAASERHRCAAVYQKEEVF